MPPTAAALRPQPRVCVIGTSNSAGAGSYAGELARTSWFGSVVNRALGFCSSDLFAFRKTDLDFSAFDLCILDFAPNDGALLAGSRLDIDRIQHVLAYAVSEISRAGCLPVITILPVARLMPAGGAVRRVYTKVAQRYGLPFFDGYAFLDRILKVDPDAPEPGLFKDPMHVNPQVSKLIGECLGEALHQLWSAPIHLDAAPGIINAHAYTYMPAENLLQDHPVIHCKTAMVEANLVHLAGDTTVRVKVPEGHEVTSLVANFSRCRGVLSVTGDITTRLGITSKTYTEDPAAKMTLGIYPLPATVKSDRGEITISLAASGPCDRTVGLEGSADDSPSLMFGGFIARAPRAPRPLRRMLPDAVELGSLIPDQRLMAARAGLGSPAAAIHSGKLGYE